MEIFNFDPSMVLSFYLTLFRVSIVLFIMPFFGDTLPNTMKAALLLVLTLAVWPKLSFPGTAFPAHPFNIAIMFAGEIVLGRPLAASCGCSSQPCRSAAPSSTSRWASPWSIPSIP